MKIFINIFFVFLLIVGCANEIYAQDILQKDLMTKTISFEDAPVEQYTKVKASHILVDTKLEADTLLKRLNEGETFESLAKNFSKCPSGKLGGDLGYFTRGAMVKPFEDVAFSLSVGAISQPVKTQFGWHIIKVYDKI